MKAAAATSIRTLVAVFLVGMAISLGPMAFGSAAPWYRAHTWVETHTASLPTDLAEFALFPATYQREIYKALSPVVRYRMWREHILMAIREDEGLTLSQQSYLNACLDALAPSDVVTNATFNNRLASLLREGAAVLGERASLLKDVLSPAPVEKGIGRWVGGRARLQALRVNVTESLWSFLAEPVVSASAGTKCNCWIASGGVADCGGGEWTVCCPSGPNNEFCDRAEGTCDWFKIRPCDGWCCTLFFD